MCIRDSRSTLEEAKDADIILHVIDASNPQLGTHMHVVYETLVDLEIRDKTIISVFNKVDKLEDENNTMILKDFKADRTVRISAKTGEGLNQLLETIEEILKESKVLLEMLFDYKDAGEISMVRKYGQLLEEDYRDEGIFVRAYVPKEIFVRLNNRN